MKRLPSITLTLALLLSAVSLSGAPNPVVSARQSVVSIVKPTPDGWRRVCSGAIVLLQEGPRVVTAGHCVTNASVAVQDIDGRVWPAGVERHEFNPTIGERDYAVLTTPLQYLVPGIRKALEPPAWGADLFAWSSPLGIAPILMGGMYAGRVLTGRSEPFDGMMLVTMNGDHGSSGSVILDARGRAVGIVARAFTQQSILKGLLLSELP